MKRAPFPAWASGFARSGLDEPGRLPRLFDADRRKAWREFASDDERRAALDGLVFFCLFGDLDAIPRPPSPADSYKAFRKLAGSLRKAAHELALARHHARLMAGFAGVWPERLREAAERLEGEAKRRPFQTTSATRADFVCNLSAHVKARTGRYHDRAIAALTGAIFPGEELTENAVKLIRRRCQPSMKIAPDLTPTT